MTRCAFTLLMRRVQPSKGSHAGCHRRARFVAGVTRFIQVTVIHVMVLAMLGCAAAAAAQNLVLEPVAEGLTAPLHLEEPADGSGRKFIVQQNGVVQVLGPDGRLEAEPFLDLRPRLLPLEQNFEERGLLGFALHPQFARNGRVFATYSAPLRPAAPERWNHTRRVSEFSADPGNLAKIDAASERVLLEIDWPSRKHNGGALAFGPDGFLYIGLGDGGIAHGIGKTVLWEAFEVPAQALTWDGLAQDTESLFGKILRIDVDRGFPGYAIPRDNPFASGPGKKEIWAWGFRNPFRIAFDRNDGSFFVTAVAETLWEAAYQLKALATSDGHCWRGRTAWTGCSRANLLQPVQLGTTRAIASCFRSSNIRTCRHRIHRQSLA